MPRLTLRHPVSATTLVKRSRFVATAGPVASPAEARAFIDAHSDPKARHNCWAFRIDENTARQSDDGEPGGTAGAPMLATLAAGEFVRTAVVVVRYFGGIKLGTGGLARAYAGAVAECLKGAATEEWPETVDATVTASFESVGAVFAVVERYTRVDSTFSDAGAEIVVRLREGERAEFVAAVSDATKGAAVVRFDDDDEVEFY